MRKIIRVMYSYIRSKFIPTPCFLRLIPTDKCNLQCGYCWQSNNDNPSIMSQEDFNAYLAKAVKLGVGIISFLGGEPMTWPHIYYAIKACSKNNILTDMTTNGTLLSEKNLNELGDAELDMLNISMDSLAETSNKGLKNGLYDRLEFFKSQYKTHVRLNAVITRTNINEVEKLIEFAYKAKYPLSLGFVVPPISDNVDYRGSYLLFRKSDFKLLEETVKMILKKKKEQGNIIDPDAYFQGIFDFLEGNNNWDCKFSRETVSGITIAPDGKLRTCSKLMDYVDYKFLDLSPALIKEIRKSSVAIIEKCNSLCYSNCAYDAYYYNRHKFEFLIRQLFPAILF